MVNKWCPLLSNGYRFESDQTGLTYSPCCWIYPRSFSDKSDLKKLKSSIQYFANKEIDKYCSSCITREAAGKSSMRQRYSKVMQNLANDELFVDVATDIRCNASCIMCGPELSTTWQKELGIEIISTEKQQDTKAELIAQSINIQKVKLWNFVGGEPLLVSTHKKILEQVDDLSDVILTYHTNGSIFPDQEAFNFWSQTKRCMIWFSIDGTGQQFEYIRYPLLWDSVINNIEKIINSAAGHNSIKFGIQITVNPLNLLYLSNIVDCFENLSKKTNVEILIEYDICAVRFDLSAATPSLRDEASKIYHPGHMVLNFLEQLPYNQDKARELISDANTLDRRRNLNWRDTFPLASKHYDIQSH